MPQKMNNEQIGVSSISSTTLSSATSTTAAGNSSAAAAQLIKAISTGAATANANGNGNATATGTGNAKDKDKDTNIATLVTKIQAIIPDTPIVSIAAGTLSESTSTTTSTKTTPTPYFQEQLTTLMSHNVKLEQRPANDSSNSNSNSYDLSNKNNNSSQSASVLTQNHVPAGDKKSTNTNTNSNNSNNNNAAGSSTNSSIANAAHHNLNLTPLLSKSGQPAPEVIAAATALHQRRGATTKGKTQDDQNVGKRQKNKKTKYDAWEDSEINDLDDASLKKLLEEAYWYRNPGDRKNKSERFLQMLKKAEYDEANSYRAIKTCLTRNTSASSSTSSGYYGHSSSVGSGSNFGAHNSSSSYHTNHRTASQRHKQGGSLQDLVEATHRSELATTSSAAAAAAATQRFNCDYQLIGASSSSGGNSNTRANRRQQHNNSSNSNSNSNNQNSAVVGKKSLKNNNSNSSSVSVRQREGGSLPSSVNFEMANMDGKQKLAIGDEGVAGNANPNPNPNPNTVNASTSKGNRNNTGSSSSSSLPSQLNETGNTVIEFDVDGNGDRDAAAADVGGAIGGGAIGGGAIGGGAIGGGDGGGALTASQLFDEALEVRDGTVEMWDINLDQTLWDMINYSQAYSNAEDEHLLNDSSKLQAARNDKGMPNVAANQAMPLKCENQLDILKQQQQQQQQQQEQQQQQQQQPDGKDLGPVKEFLIDDPLHFSMLETSAKNQKLEQQQLPLPQYPPALASAVASGQFTLPLGEQKRKVDAGYVSLNDSYTACSSVFGLAGNFSSGSKSSSKGSGGGNSAELFGGADLRPAKIGRMMTAAAAAAVVASHGAKATTRQFDENGNALGDGYAAGNGTGSSNNNNNNSSSSSSSNNNCYFQRRAFNC